MTGCIFLGAPQHTRQRTLTLGLGSARLPSCLSHRLASGLSLGPLVPHVVVPHRNRLQLWQPYGLRGCFSLWGTLSLKAALPFLLAFSIVVETMVALNDCFWFSFSHCISFHLRYCAMSWGVFKLVFFLRFLQCCRFYFLFSFAASETSLRFRMLLIIANASCAVLAFGFLNFFLWPAGVKIILAQLVGICSDVDILCSYFTF